MIRYKGKDDKFYIYKNVRRSYNAFLLREETKEKEKDEEY